MIVIEFEERRSGCPAVTMVFIVKYEAGEKGGSADGVMVLA